MRKIHAAYSQAHYGHHLNAIHQHLPDDIRGVSLQTSRTLRELPEDDIIMVAGYGDIQLARGRNVIFLEHGAGQRYSLRDQNAARYYGGPYPDNVIAYLGPRQAVVDDVGLPGVAIGSPICDPYELHGEEGVCAITWHWAAARVCPEADTALKHYLPRLPEIVSTLREQGWEVIGHRHPRLRSYVNLWRKLGVEEVDHATVRRRAALLIADNTSLAFEMSYLCRQNLVLNAPWYRRDVEHGLRFWEAPPGVQADDPEELIDIIQHLENHLPRTYTTRGAIAAYDKPYSDGMDGMRAAAWLTMNVPL